MNTSIDKSGLSIEKAKLQHALEYARVNSTRRGMPLTVSDDSAGALALIIKALNAGIAYDAAIQHCADMPDAMSSYCTAQGVNLDTLYAAWIDASWIAVEVALNAKFAHHLPHQPGWLRYNFPLDVLEIHGCAYSHQLFQDLAGKGNPAMPEGELIKFVSRLNGVIALERLGALTGAAGDVLSERNRQVVAEDYATEHDDSHPCGEIAAFAAVYAMPPAAREWPATETGFGETFGEALCPVGWAPKFGDRRRELVKAGALILAEIERLDRVATRLPVGQQES